MRESERTYLAHLEKARAKQRTEAEKETSMKRIWALHKQRNAQVGLTHPQPWMIENYLEPSSELDEYGIPIRINHQVTFDDYRSVDALPLWERQQRFLQARRYLYQLACQARDRAQSYRGFNVGSAVLAFKPGVPHTQSFKTFSGMNIKLGGNHRTTCSESIAIGAAHAEGFALILGLVVVGILRDEDVLAGLSRLWPCPECQVLLEHHPISHDETLVFCAMPPRVDNQHEYRNDEFVSGGYSTGVQKSVRELLATKNK